MAINMAKTIKEERLRWILPIINKEVKLVDVAKICPHSKRSLERWCKLYREKGENGLEPKATIPRTSPNETSIRIKETIIQKRKETKLCALKLHWRLSKEGLNIPVRTIGKIIKDEGLVRKYRKKKVKYKYIKAVLQPGELVEIDVKHVPGKVASKRYYQYTAIDCASRWRYLKIYDGESISHSIDFLKEIMKRFPHTIQAVKTDNGAVFTNRYNESYKREDLSPRKMHALDWFCAKHNIVHYLIDPGKPAQNGKVERSHRSDQESFYDRNTFRNIKELQRKIILWNTEYNNLEHCGLNGKTPNEFLEDYQLINPPNVLA
jgi:transposase InsO family protein